MSGRRRLAVFLGLLWIGLWFVAYLMDPVFNWEGFFLLAISPVALVTGVVWVVNGFRQGENR